MLNLLPSLVNPVSASSSVTSEALPSLPTLFGSGGSGASDNGTKFMGTSPSPTEPESDIKVCFFRENAGTAGGHAMRSIPGVADALQCSVICEEESTCIGGFFHESQCELFDTMDIDRFYDENEVGRGSLITCTMSEDDVLAQLYGQHYPGMNPASALNTNNYSNQQISNSNTSNTAVVNNITVVVPNRHSGLFDVLARDSTVHQSGRSTGSSRQDVGSYRTGPNPIPSYGNRTGFTRPYYPSQSYGPQVPRGPPIHSGGRHGGYYDQGDYPNLGYYPHHGPSYGYHPNEYDYHPHPGNGHYY